MNHKSGYTIIRNDRSNKGGGLAFIVHDTVIYRAHNFQNINQTDQHLEQPAIAVTSGETEIIIVNVYIPPHSSCDSGYQASIDHLLKIKDCIILRDINALHSLWYSQLNDDARGNVIADEIDNNDVGVLNEDSPAQITANTSSSPDISIIASSLITTAEWNVDTALNSDHLPITITLNRRVKEIYPSCRTFVNFGKAHWESFTTTTEAEFARLNTPTNVFAAEKYSGEFYQTPRNI